MTAPHPDAIGTHGPEFLAWSAERFGMHPKRTTGHRWWQQLVAHRALEHDSDGRLLWETVVNSTPRQSGKSWILREMCLWRLAQADRFGEVQTVVHTALQLKHAFSVWRPAGRWAMARDGYKVRFANGEQQIEAADGSLWMIQAANDGLGVSLSVSMGLVDEAWSVDRDLIDNALVPTVAESEQPQLWFISTAGVPRSGERITDLMPSYRSVGMDRGQSQTLFVEWSAPRSADIDDPGVWRAASAFWDDRRLRRVSSARAAAVTDRQVEAFRRQWLNQWPEDDALSVPGWVLGSDWSACARDGLVVPLDRCVVGLSLDESDGSWPVVAANRVEGGGIGVRLVGVYGSQAGAQDAARGAVAGRAALLLTPQHALRGQVKVQGVRESFNFHEGDVASALTLARIWVGQRELLHDPADEALSAAVLGVPLKRQHRSYGPGVLALVCAWWAHKQRPVSVVA